MIYLDYAADSPVSENVLDTFVEMEKAYIANPNAAHGLGMAAREKINEVTQSIAACLQVQPSEIIYTSGATESNNLAIKGALQEYKRYGKHVITTVLEHSSVTGPLMAMQEMGFEVDYVQVNAEGKVDLEHLQELLRPDTILVSTVYVDSECGIIQPVRDIAELVHQMPHCLYHVDATQAVGKIPLDLKPMDLVTMTAHKCLHGFGLLVKKEAVNLKPLHSGGLSTTPFRSGTPSLALCASMEVALKDAIAHQQEAYAQVKQLSDQLRKGLSAYQKVRINSSQEGSPFIFNISVLGVKPEQMMQALEKEEIYVASKSACTSPNTPSRAVYAMTHDRKRAMTTLRISMSHLTTPSDVEGFLASFEKHYHQLVK